MGTYEYSDPEQPHLSLRCAVSVVVGRAVHVGPVTSCSEGVYTIAATSNTPWIPWSVLIYFFKSFLMLSGYSYNESCMVIIWTVGL